MLSYTEKYNRDLNKLTIYKPAPPVFEHRVPLIIYTIKEISLRKLDGKQHKPA